MPKKVFKFGNRERKIKSSEIERIKNYIEQVDYEIGELLLL